MSRTLSKTKGKRNHISLLQRLWCHWQIQFYSSFWRLLVGRKLLEEHIYKHDYPCRKIALSCRPVFISPKKIFNRIQNVYFLLSNPFYSSFIIFLYLQLPSNNCRIHDFPLMYVPKPSKIWSFSTRFYSKPSVLSSFFFYCCVFVLSLSSLFIAVRMTFIKR